MAQDPGPKVIPVGSDGVEGVKIKGRNAAGHTFQNAAAAAGNGTALVLSGETDLAVQVEGAASSFTVIPEGTIDGANWHTLTAVNKGTLAQSNAITVTGLYAFDVDGLTRVRMRLSAIADNSVTVTGN